MSKETRLSKLESSAGGGGDDPKDVIHDIRMDKDDNITTVIIADGEEMTQHEFNRRWPNYVDTELTVKVVWD